MRIYIKVIPRSSKKEVTKTAEGEYKVRLTAPPVDGEANKQLIEMLAEHFGVGKGAVSILGGKSARIKIIEISGL